MANDEIIEKSASSPIATSCLVVAAASLVCAIGIQLVEVGQLRADGEITPQTRSEISRLESAAQKVIDENTEGDDNRPFHQEAQDAVEGADASDEEGAEEESEEEEEEEKEEG